MESDTNLALPVKTILALRNSPASRRNMRLARFSPTEHHAYPDLAWLWSNSEYPTNRLALLRFASLAAAYPAMPFVPTVTLGRAARLTVIRKTIQEDSIATSLMVVQDLAMEQALPSFDRILSLYTKGGGGLDWQRMYYMLQLWDSKDPARRAANRRQLLEDFYASGIQEGPPTN